MTVRPDYPVAKVMSWPVAAIDHEATLAEASEAMTADGVGALVVLRQGRLAGVLSERDVVAHVAGDIDLTHTLVGDAMAVELVTVTPETTVLEAARAMATADVRHLPVLTEDRIAGVVSVRDVLAVLAEALGPADVAVPSGGRAVFRTR